MAALGGVLGASEGLTFAWAGGGEDPEVYWGAGLVGGGVGTTLGLAASASSDFTAQRALVATGFSAWGGWIGSFSGALVDTDPRAIVLGGVAGANLGFASGYALTSADLFEAQDFGWLSLAGAVGTVGGAGVGALFSTAEDRSPIYAGLAAGPLVGMGAGALMLPVLRSFGHGPPTTTAARPSGREPRLAHARRRGRWRQLLEVAGWQPIVGALPSLGLAPDAQALGGGVTGTLR
jgi:hypothetical protein